jgi:hypothetical protein
MFSNTLIKAQNLCSKVLCKNHSESAYCLIYVYSFNVNLAKGEKQFKLGTFIFFTCSLYITLVIRHHRLNHR